MTAVATTPLLRVAGLTKSFGARTVLNNVSLDIVKGETIVIIGASGSGKTTLLRCINYLERPTDGAIYLDGRRIGFVPIGEGSWQDASERILARQRRAIGFVFQRFNLFPHLSALDNVSIGLRKVAGVPKRVARERAAEHLRRVFLGEHLDKRPSQLSGGQQQRVAIARAIAMEPDIILYDEPTSALDPELVREVLDAIRMAASSGMTSMIVTHELSFARQVANRVIYMDEGVIVEQGEPSALFAAPREARTRRFLEHFHSSARQETP
ncbi:MAG TPA: amino acid ABC transporter ATP-binding protein [Casimicrobiaceae bacterium]|nr:amino acid ABC transporter ATP-binding protein [Casimicrobiaceae bacterium]